MKRVISLFLVLAMIGTLAACGSTKQGETKESSNVDESTGTVENTSEASKEEVEEPVTITMYPYNANLTSGTVGGWFGEYLAEHGLSLDIWAYSDEKLNAILASEDLPDILYLKGSVDFKTISESGMLLDLEPYMDQMPHVAENEVVQTAINYMKEFVTDGAVTMLPNNIYAAGTLNATATERNAVKMNWTVYEQIGRPSFSNLDELIDVLKKMQEAYPKAEDGSKTYAMHLFNDMDTDYFYGMYNYFAVTGYDYEELPYFIESDAFGESFDYILADDSNYKQGLAYLNRFYKEGLLDPESINTARSAQHVKIEAGGALAGWAGVPGWEANGYYPVYFDEVKTRYALGGAPYGNGTYVAINAKSENIDAALKFVDMMADPEKLRVMISGPEGEMWERDANGNAILTEKGKGWWVNGTPAVFESGEEYVLFNSSWVVSPNTRTSDGVQAGMNASDECKALKADTEFQRDWQELYGYDNYMKLMQDKDSVITNPFDLYAAKFAGTASDEQQLIMTAAKDIIVTASWKMVYAETEADFEKIWDEAVADCEELGIKDIFEWRVSELQKGIEIRDSLAK